MTRVGVVALDANILVPIVACDFLLTAVHHELFEPVVSATVLDEVERTLVEDFAHIDADALSRRVRYMRVALADHIIDTSTADVATTINAKDRHVVAAAIAGEATVVVTEDQQLRTEITASIVGLSSLDADGFAMRLWSNSADDVNDVIRQLIAKRRRRPVSGSEMAGQLSTHFPSMSAMWRDRFPE